VGELVTSEEEVHVAMEHAGIISLDTFENIQKAFHAFGDALLAVQDPLQELYESLPDIGKDDPILFPFPDPEPWRRDSDYEAHSDTALHLYNPGDDIPPKVGRNSLCPCGSGQKFKKCCIDKEGETE